MIVIIITVVTTIINTGHSILYEEGQDADEDLTENLSLFLDACPNGGVVEGSILTVEDFSQDLTVSQWV